jgi:NitT/TauT family transport system substrate-binding protein
VPHEDAVGLQPDDALDERILTRFADARRRYGDLHTGVARTLEAGVITKYILGNENGNAFAAGCALTSDFIKVRPDVARRFAAVWKKGIDFVNENPQEARKYLAKNTLTPEDVVDTVPMVRYFMAGDLTAEHKAEFQKFIDFSTEVGTVPEKVDITKYLQVY